MVRASKVGLLFLFIAIIAIVMGLSGCSSSGGGGGGGAVIDSEGTDLDNQGFIQKGPFIKGSQIIVQELDSKLSPTGRTYQFQTTDDFGSFRITSRITSPYIEIIAQGYYYDEVRGELSASMLTLRALSEVSVGLKMNVNVLTTLEKERIRHLMLNKGKSFAEARTQAEEEILDAFRIPEDKREGMSRFADMDIRDQGDGNAVLLAISCQLQGTNTVAQLSEFMTRISDDLANDGSLDDQGVIDRLKNTAMSLDPISIRTNLEARYRDLGLNINVPVFEDFIDTDGDGVINKYDYSLESPSGTTNSSKPVFRWTDSGVPDARYHIQIAQDAGFAIIVEQASGLTGTSYIPTNIFANNTVYYWRVLVAGEDGKEYVWDTYRQFSIDLRPDYNLITPNGIINNSMPIFDWTDSGITNPRYHIQVAKDAGFTMIVEEASDLMVSSYSLSKPLENKSLYYWRIFITDENGVEFGGDSYRQFSIDLGKVTLEGPFGTRPYTKPYFNWSDSMLPDVRYHFQLSTDMGFGTIIEEEQALTSSDFYLMSMTLDNLSNYYWRVAVVDKNDVKGEWSSTGTFRIDLESVALYSPGSSTLTNNALTTFTWGRNVNAATYRLIISDSPDLSSPVVEQTGISGISYTLGTPLSNTDGKVYYWAVLPIDSNGVSGTRSDVWNFTLDTMAPTGSVVINNGDETTDSETVQLNISSPDAGQIQSMYISRDGTFTDGMWESYSSSRTISYPEYAGTASATLNAYIQFRDVAGNVSSSSIDMIQLNRTFKSGTISSNETWSKVGNPYLITGDVQIVPDAVVTIEPGVVIRFQGPYTVTVNGAVRAEGTSSEVISFGSGSTNVSSGANMLKFTATNLSNSHLVYVRFENANRSIWLGDNIHVNDNVKNTGILNAEHLDISRADIINGGFNALGRLVISDSSLNSVLIYMAPVSENGGGPIDIYNSSISNSTIAVCGGLFENTISNSTLNNCTLMPGYNEELTFTINNSVVINGQMIVNSLEHVPNAYGLLNVSSSTFTNFKIDLAAAQVSISDSVFSYDSNYSASFGLHVGWGTIDHTVIQGNGNISGVLVHNCSNQYDAYGFVAPFAMIYSDVRDCNVGLTTFAPLTNSLNSITSSNFQNCTTYFIYNSAPRVVLASNNYWGTDDASIIDVKIFDGKDDNRYGLVEYSPYLESPQAGTGPRN